MEEKRIESDTSEVFFSICGACNLRSPHRDIERRKKINTNLSKREKKFAERMTSE